MALRDEILAAAKATAKISPPIQVPGWTTTETLHFRTLTGNDLDEIDAAALKGNLRGMRALFASLVLCDAAGNRVLTPADAKQLGDLPGNPLSWVVVYGKQFNAIDAEEVAAIPGKSEAGQGAGSGSASPEISAIRIQT